MKKSKSGRHPFVRFLFLVYAAALLWLLFGRTSAWTEGLSYKETLRQNTNLSPLLTIQNYWYVIRHSSVASLVRHCSINLVGNILLFIPPGYWLVRIWPRFRNLFLFLISCAGLILLIETLQLFTLLGRFDVDDIILNLAGMLIGYLFCLLRHRKK